MEMKLFDTVRIKDEERGGRNEFGKIMGFTDSGLVWVSNLNSPFQGTISMYFPKDSLEKISTEHPK